MYQAGAGVLKPRASDDGSYRAGSQKNFLKRRSGKPMSERASRLAQMQHGEGYSRGQFLSAKTTSDEKGPAWSAAKAKDEARARQRQRQGGMIIASNQNRNSPKADRSNGDNVQLPEGWTKHRHDSGRMYYCNRSTGQTQWEPPAQEANSWSNAPAQAAETVHRNKAQDSDDGNGDPMMRLKNRMETAETHVNRLQDKENELIKALEQVRLKKAEAQSDLEDHQNAYEDALNDL